ncbi:MAG: chloride channel protein, partial [Calditrichaeota bacterium]
MKVNPYIQLLKKRKIFRKARNSLIKFSQTYFLRFKATEHTFMVVVAILIGLFGGFGAVGIQFAIKLFQKVFWKSWTIPIEYLQHLPWTHKLLAPAIGGLIVGLIVQYVAQEAKGHGVPEVMEAIAIRNGIIRPRVVIAKLLASSICIGSGGSVGREGPVIQIGSSIGSAIGQFLQVNAQRMKTFVACGAAAGIAAAFNAPVAGALFSVEIILGDFAVPQFSPIVISSVVATVVSRSFLGDFPAFQVPKYNLVSPFELIPYAGLGIFAGFVALMFIKTLDRTE